MDILNKSKESFNLWAKSYDSGILLPVYFSRVQRKIQRFIGDVKGKRVIDIGCGTGNFLTELAKNNSGSSFLGIDISEEMISIARHKARGIDNLEFKIGKAEDIQSENNVDDIISTFSFHHWPNQEGALEKIYGALKPRGRLIITDVNLFGGSGTNKIVRPKEMGKMLRRTGFSETYQLSATDSGKYGFVSAVAGLPVSVYGIVVDSLSSVIVATAMIAGGIIYSIPNWMSKISVGIK